jgi:hypothetical protein
LFSTKINAPCSLYFLDKTKGYAKAEKRKRKKYGHTKVQSIEKNICEHMKARE